MTNSKNIKMDWVPNERVGPFKFETPINDYVSEFEIALDDELVGTGSKNYYVIVDTEITFFAENDVIEAVSCDEEFIFKGKNLIGLKREEFMTLMGREPDEIGEAVEFENGIALTPFEYDDLGLEVWFQDNILFSASAHDARDDG